MNWNLDPIAFSVFGVSIAWYGLTWSLAILLGYAVLYYIFKKEQKDLTKLVPYIQYIFIGVLLGARLFEMLYYQFDYFIEDPMLFFRFRQGGLASHGAMLGSMISILLFVRKNKEFTFLWLLDRSLIAVLLQGAIIRIGNFMNSELIGKITAVPWAVRFTKIDDLSRHPVVLYESIWSFFCFAIFFFIYKKQKQLKPLLLTSLFLIFVLGGRVVLEFLKEAEVVFLIFSQTQLVSIAGIIIGVYLLIRTSIKPSKK
jgi:phosphatidylglycerol:prolipoprotein diacylglycerol transferase